MAWFENSFLSSYQDATRRRKALPEEVAANDNDSWYGRDPDAYDQYLRSVQGQAIAGGVITGLTGATTLLSNAYKDAQIRDTSMQEGQIADLRNAGHYNYNNYDQLANDYAQTEFNPYFSNRDIRGMIKGQKIGSVATSALTGMTTGSQIAGLPGAIGGLVLGGLTGFGGVLLGDKSAEMRQNFLNVQSDLAADSARLNYSAAHERIGDNIHRQNAINAVANGGPIKRQSINEFADKVLNKNRYNTVRRNIIRSYGEGGLTVRIKVK